MSEFSGYDQWKTTPPEEDYESPDEEALKDAHRHIDALSASNAELLSALKYVHGALNKCEHPCTCTHCVNSWAMAGQLIKKTEGK